MGFDFTVALKALVQLVGGAILVFLIMTPIVFVSALTKNQSITLIVSIVLLLLPFIIFFGGDQFDFLNSLSNYIPWSFVSSLVLNQTLEISKVTAFIVVIATFIVGYFASYLCLAKRYID